MREKKCAPSEFHPVHMLFPRLHSIYGYFVQIYSYKPSITKFFLTFDDFDTTQIGSKLKQTNSVTNTMTFGQKVINVARFLEKLEKNNIFAPTKNNIGKRQ